MIASEPLHDLKGHIINLITELPHVLPPGETATKCNLLINCCLAKEKKSGADLRRVVIQIYLLLKDLDCSSKILLLLQTIIKMGEISYSLDDCRSPRQLLQMYNTCWLHMELCRDMFGNPQKITRSKGTICMLSLPTAPPNTSLHPYGPSTLRIRKGYLVKEG